MRFQAAAHKNKIAETEDLRIDHMKIDRPKVPQRKPGLTGRGIGLSPGKNEVEDGCRDTADGQPGLQDDLEGIQDLTRMALS